MEILMVGVYLIPSPLAFMILLGKVIEIPLKPIVVVIDQIMYIGPWTLSEDTQ